MAGVDAFAHGIRDQDVDDEAVALFAEHPGRGSRAGICRTGGVAEDLSWLSGTIPSAELQEMQDAATDRPAAQEAFAIQSAESRPAQFGRGADRLWD